MSKQTELNPAEPEQAELINNTPQELCVELRFKAPLTLDTKTQEDILQALSAVMGGTYGVIQQRTLPASKEASAALLIMPERLEATTGGPAALLISFNVPAKEPVPAADITALSQTWQWDEAESIVPLAMHSITLTSVNTLHLPLLKRLGFIQLALYALTGLLQPSALHFCQSQCFIDPEAYLENKPGSDEYFLLYGLVNNRIFTSDNEEEKDVLMDTLGLHLLGMPDIQCFVQAGSLDYADLAYWIYNLAAFMCENPNVVDDGDVLVGVNEEDWDVRKDNALIEPARGVLDINTLPEE
ncbi:DUF4261 domain-containing protein [Desulfovibrio sp. OttesenSCG-928-F07]|nr:DUF4261 domain-containing protein [Desulfovibrio sp. OttesenSCG-928-F07]